MIGLTTTKIIKDFRKKLHMCTTNEDSIHIFLSTDNNYSVPAYITLFSLICNYRGKQSVNVYILTSGDLSSENLHLLSTLSDNDSRFEISFIDMKGAYNGVTFKLDHLSHAAMYRLMIPRIAEQLRLKTDKCIYLDTDIVVEGDISELYDLDKTLGKYYFAGVPDPCLCNVAHADLIDRLGIPDTDQYINSGVLLINLKQISRDGLCNQLEEAGYREDFLYNDQDAINSVCYGGIRSIPLKFNMMRQFFYHNDRYFSEVYSLVYGKDNALEAKRDPVVIHYIDRQKPWSHRTILMAEKWWKYVGMQDERTIREHIAPFAASHRAPLSDWLFETTKTILTHMGIYDMVGKAKGRLSRKERLKS